jgi:hypothetical protein
MILAPAFSVLYAVGMLDIAWSLTDRFPAKPGHQLGRCCAVQRLPNRGRLSKTMCRALWQAGLIAAIEEPVPKTSPGSAIFL